MPKTIALSCGSFGGLGFLAGHAINGSGPDIAGLTVAGLWLGAVFGTIETAPLIAGWFLGWMIGAIALADWALHLGAWGILFGFGGLLIAALVVLILLARSIDLAYEEGSGYSAPSPGFIRRLLVLHERLIGRLIWYGSFAFVFFWISMLELDLGIAAAIIAAALGLIAGGVLDYCLGAEDRREEKEYYNDDDLDGTFLRLRPEKIPEAGSALPVP